MCGLSKTPGGGKITFDFIAKMLASANGAGLFTYLIVSTVDGHEFNTDLHLVDSSSKLSSLHPLNPKKSLTLGFCSNKVSSIVRPKCSDASTSCNEAPQRLYI